MKSKSIFLSLFGFNVLFLFGFFCVVVFLPSEYLSSDLLLLQIIRTWPKKDCISCNIPACYYLDDIVQSYDTSLKEAWEDHDFWYLSLCFQKNKQT